MFDRDIYFTQSAYQHQTHTHNHKITEKKAPTDESMRLLDEFRKEAINSIIEANMISLPDINANIMYIRSIHHLGFGEVIKYKVTLNGKEYINSFDLDLYEVKEINTETLMHRIIKEATSFIVSKITANAYLKNLKNLNYKENTNN